MLYRVLVEVTITQVYELDIAASSKDFLERAVKDYINSPSILGHHPIDTPVIQSQIRRINHIEPVKEDNKNVSPA